jgi:hypothetical protein
LAALTAQDRVDAALKPLVDHPERWTLHVPMYLNTFCFAYHLANSLAKKGSPDRLNLNFVTDEWWREHPTFMYRTDVEIFVAVRSTIKKLAAKGHNDLREVEFTKYAQAYLFSRNGRQTSSTVSPFIVTDIPQTVELLKTEWSRTSPQWLQRLNISDVTRMPVRSAWDRHIGDLFDSSPKIYAFSAPMTHLFFAQSSGSSPKYALIDETTAPIPTYYVIRCNTGVPLQHVRAIEQAILAYYSVVFDPLQAAQVIDARLAEKYAQMAITSGQPNPFPEVYPGDAAAGLAKGAGLADRYVEILNRHHRP